MFVEKEGEAEIGFTKIIIRGPHQDLYYATTQDRFFKSSEIDLDNLDKIPVDTDTIWPRYSARFLQAVSPIFFSRVSSVVFVTCIPWASSTTTFHRIMSCLTSWIALSLSSIDFDSWGREGQKFEDGMKKGAVEWSINGSSYEYELFENDNYGLTKLREFIYDPSSGKPLSKSTSANSSQTSTSSTTSSGGPQDVSDAFGTTPETPIEVDGQNTTTPPPPKEKENKYKFWGWGKINDYVDKQKAGPK
ncbi:hypothetical protein E4U26_000137 [Claviceps purpurea]|nr:hypothetical protein E4U26_000137 [Claviceps purpurea]